ncbi:hypothetical protein BN871_BK_00360 [Paenibacillus sp. P22]|nr:hypothetical protein BN871_BK_00360 [Paenibacillus sp. P22]
MAAARLSPARSMNNIECCWRMLQAVASKPVPCCMRLKCRASILHSRRTDSSCSSKKRAAASPVQDWRLPFIPFRGVGEIGYLCPRRCLPPGGGGRQEAESAQMLEIRSEIDAQLRGQPLAELGIGAEEVADRAQLCGRLDGGEIGGQVADKRILLGRGVAAEHLAGLAEVVGLGDALASCGSSGFERSGSFGIGRIRLRRVEVAARLIIDGAAELAVLHGAVTLVVAHLGERAVDRQLQVVRSDPVTLRIGVGEEASLEQFVLGRLDARDDDAGIEADLLRFGKDVVGIAVQLHRADMHVRDILLEPILGRIERIEVEGIEIGRIEDLDEQIPFREVAAVNGVDKVARGVVEVAALNLRRLLGAEAAHALLRHPPQLGVHAVAMLVHPFERMDAGAAHLAVVRGNAFVGEQMHQHVGGLGSQRHEIPVAVGCLQVRAWIRLQGVDHVRELHRVADEEDRQVVADKIVVPLRRIELDGEAARIAQRLGGMLAVDDGGEADEDRRLGSGILQERRLGPALHAGRRAEYAMRACAAGMDDALRHAFPVEMGQLLQQLVILQQRRAVLSGSSGILVVSDRDTLVRRKSVHRKLPFLRLEFFGISAHV